MTGCSVAECQNRSEGNFSMFRFPADPSTRTRWIRACHQGPDWKPGPGSRVCEVHFASTQQKNAKRLVRGAVPTLFCLCLDPERKALSSSQCDNIQASPLKPHQLGKTSTDHHYCKTMKCAPRNRYPGCSLTGTPNTASSFTSTSDTASNSSLLSKAPDMDVTVSTLKGENAKLMKEAQSLHLAASMSENLTALGKKFSETQLAASVSGNSRGRKWPTSDVRTAMSLCWSAGPSALNVLRDRENVAPLPSLRTIQRRVQHIKFEPGIFREVLEAFRPIVESFHPLDRDCCLFFDDMSISSKRDMDPSTAKYIGDITLPGITGMATKTTLYMFGGCRAHWKVAAAYHNVGDESHPAIQADILKEVLRVGAEFNLNILAIVCDMGNRGVTNALGFSTKKEDMTYRIPHPNNQDKPLFLIPDSVHLFKSAKEGLVNKKFFTISDSVVREYNLSSDTVHLIHIQWLDEHQSDMHLQFAPGLSSKNIQASHFNKMKSTSARSVFSHKVACGLMYKVKTGEAPQEYSVTAWFVSIMNRWFELMTRRSLQLALSKRNEEAYCGAITHLQLVVKLFRNIKFVGGGKPIQTHIIVATEAVLDLQDYLLSVRRYDFVFLGRFLQDVVENMFSLIRRKRPNPTTLQVKQSLRQIVVARLSGHVKGSSYDLDDREDPVDLLSSVPKPQLQVHSNLQTPTWQELTSSTPVLDKCQEDVLYRMCGYVIHKLIERLTLKCDGCISSLKHKGPLPHPNALWTSMTNYGDNEPQVAVSDEVFHMLRKVEFNLLQWKNILMTFKTAILPVIMSVVMPNLTSHHLSTCHDVKEDIVQYWVNMRLKQLTVNLTGRNLVQSQSQLSSRSMGSRLLSERFRGTSSKNSISPCEYPQSTPTTVSRIGKDGHNTVKYSSAVIVKVNSSTIDCSGGRHRKKTTVPAPTAQFLSNVSSKVNTFKFLPSNNASLHRLLL